MPRSRESRQPIDIWPGFVDALSTLLLSIIFLLVVFVLGQFFLGQMLQGKNRTVGELQGQMRDLRQKLRLEESSAGELRSTLDRTSADLRAAAQQRDELTGRLTLSERDREQLGLKLATLTDDQLKLQRALDGITTDRAAATAKLEDVQKVLAEAQKTVGADKGTIDLQVGQLMALRRDIDSLNQEKTSLEAQVNDLAQGRVRAETQGQSLEQEVASLQQELRSLSSALGIKQHEADQQNAKIADLGSQLNAALATRVKELSQYRSDFFGRLRQTLGNRDDVRIVGDRFVFQSEVLFDSGAAEINPSGQAQLAKLATTLRDIEKEIPPELPWVLQVDGHTDARPINTPQFPSNWELSAARAIAVVKFLANQGIPPDRLAARGFASFQPLDQASTEDAYRKNRRIEIKFTTR